MNKKNQQDFRTTLNLILSLYYIHKKEIFAQEHFSEIGLEISDQIIEICSSTLLADGYIEEIELPYSHSSRIFYARITGKGCIFHEQGGYKDATTHVDKIINWAKNNKAVAWIIVTFIVLASLKTAVDLGVQLFSLFK